MNDRKIEPSDGRYFGRQQFLTNSTKIFISDKKKWLIATRYLKRIKIFLTLELSQYRKSGSTFSSSEPVAARTGSDCRLLGNALCLCSLVQPAQAVPDRVPKISDIDFAVKSFDCLLE